MTTRGTPICMLPSLDSICMEYLARNDSIAKSCKPKNVPPDIPLLLSVGVLPKRYRYPSHSGKYICALA